MEDELGTEYFEELIFMEWVSNIFSFVNSTLMKVICQLFQFPKIVSSVQFVISFEFEDF